MKAMSQLIDESPHKMEMAAFRECKTTEFLNNPGLYSSRRSTALAALNQKCYNELDIKMDELRKTGMPLSKMKQVGAEYLNLNYKLWKSQLDVEYPLTSTGQWILDLTDGTIIDKAVEHKVS